MAVAENAFEVRGMHCASCALLIDDVVEELPGVNSCQTDTRRDRSVVRYDPTAVAPADIVAAIRDAGYEATLEENA